MIGTNLMRKFGLAIELVLLWLSPAFATPAFAADVDNGRRLALRWCASCHVVAANQRQPTHEATPFATIAKRPGFDEAQLALSLLGPHPPMPDMALTRSEAADVAAYIASLK
jgi:mono/diheme cytochrome c family protein